MRILRTFLALTWAPLGCLIISLAMFGASRKDSTPTKLPVKGKQPAVAVDEKGGVKLVFGEGERILYTSSPDQGRSFVTPVEIGQLKGLALGMARAPQIAATGNFTVVAAANSDGNIFAYNLDQATSHWSQPIRINDVDTIAKEAFVAIAGQKNRFFAVWLDLRGNRKNKIYGASSEDGGKHWSKNILVYQSPEGTVCECCKPSVTMDQQGNVHVQFRNWLRGSRDLYLISSSNGGRTFGAAQKLGTGTWPLKGCPMDGGDIAVNNQGKLATVWRRKNEVFLAEPGQPEKLLGEGRSASLAATETGNFVAWQREGEVLVRIPDGKVITMGKGAYPRIKALSASQGAICTWENEDEIFIARIP